MDEYDTALNGDGKGYIGFINIINDYSGTDAANLANLYAGLSYAHKGKAQEAIKYLEDYSAGDDMMVSPAAIAALGNCYAEVGDVDKAIKLLLKAAKKADNNSLSPTFLIQAGELYESQGKNEDALDCYNQVKEKYTESMQYQEIDKYIERASK
jgi:tetratricopeptide (TPR) repeat protein